MYIKLYIKNYIFWGILITARQFRGQYPVRSKVISIVFMNNCPVNSWSVSIKQRKQRDLLILTVKTLQDRRQ